MDERLTSEIAEITEMLRWRKKLRADMDEAERHARRHRHAVDDMDAKLATERAEAEAMDGMTLSAMVARIAGTQVQRLAKERADVARLLTQRQHAADAAANAERFAADCRRRVERLNDLEKKRDAMLKRQEAALRAGDSETGRRLASLAEQTGELRADRKEIEEARDAARKAHEALMLTTSYLISGSNIGAYDTLGSAAGLALGGGPLQYDSSTRDHSLWKQMKLDQARTCAQMAQAALDDLERELRDVSEHVDPKRFNTPTMTYDGWHQYFDIFMDNIFSDLISLSRTKENRLRINEITERVTEVIGALQLVHEEVIRCLDEAEAERKRLIAMG